MIKLEFHTLGALGALGTLKFERQRQTDFLRIAPLSISSFIPRVHSALGTLSFERQTHSKLEFHT